MAIYRVIQMSFWTDPKIVDDFTPEDRYFYLYLLTNPHTNLIGCYELSIKQASDETGYTKEVIENLIQRFESIHNLIRYSTVSKEILLINWSKFNWTKSDTVKKSVLKNITEVKSADFRAFLTDMTTVFDTNDDTASIPYTDPMDTTVTVTVTNTNTNKGKGGMGGKPKPSKIKSEFEKLWSLYPRKQGKERAKGYYERARKDGTTYEEVERGIMEYVAYIEENNTEMRYVKQGATFFSQKSWEDEWLNREERNNGKEKRGNNTGTGYTRKGQAHSRDRDIPPKGFKFPECPTVPRTEEA